MVHPGVVFGAEFWILDPLYVSLGTLLAWFFSLAHSYGVAIILLTVVVRLATLPLTAKQARSQQDLQRLQPELKRLQAKYKHDRQKLNEEMMKFYRENKVNPLGGCLPLLVQFPVLLVLYRLIMGLIDTPPKHVPKTSAMYADLVESGGEMVSFGMDLAKRAGDVSGGKQVPFLILIGLVMATGYFQQRQMTARLPKESRNSQMVMIGKIFPLMFGVISWTIPAAVVVYFLASNVWQIGQQAVIFRKMPLPTDAGKGTKDVEKGKEEKGKPAKGTPTAKGKGDSSGKKGAPTPKRTPGSSRTPAKGAGKGRPPAKGQGKAKGAPSAGGKGARPGQRAQAGKAGGKATPVAKGGSAGKASSARGANARDERRGNGRTTGKGSSRPASGADGKAKAKARPPASSASVGAGNGEVGSWWQRLRGRADKADAVGDGSAAGGASSEEATESGDTAVVGETQKKKDDE